MYTKIKNASLENLQSKIDVITTSVKKLITERNSIKEEYSRNLSKLNEEFRYYILFPSMYDNVNIVDEAFESEFKIATLLGFKTILFDYDKFIKTGSVKTNDVYFNESSKVIYRGWMLNGNNPFGVLRPNYSKLAKEFSYRLINNTHDYEYCHYSGINDTLKFLLLRSDIIYPKSIHYGCMDYNNDFVDLVCNSFEYAHTKEKRDIFDSSRTKSYIIKDGVKSEKGTDCFMLSPGDDFRNKIQNFVNLRSTLFNGYIQLKEVLPIFRNSDNNTHEIRAFVLNNQIVDVSCNSGIDFEIPETVFTVIQQIIDLKIDSKFYTIDLFMLENEKWALNEIGDGQVSGLASQASILAFYTKLQNILNDTIC